MFTNLTDDDLMLLLCERPERLDDPAAWCSNLRELASRPDPATAVEAEARIREWDGLRSHIPGA